MARYGQPFWWLRGSLKTWLKNYPTTDKNEAITKWIDAYIEAMEENYTKSGQVEGTLAPGLKYALTREFCYHTSIRLYVQDLELVKFLKSTSCPQLGAAKAVMSDFMEKYGSMVHILLPDKQTITCLISDCPNVPEWLSYAVYCEDNYDQSYITEDTSYAFRESLEAVYDKEVVGDKRVEKLLDTKVLIVNLLYYIAAFPDALIDGAPTDKGGIQLLPKSNHSVVIKTHPDIIEPRVPGSRVTHFRHGHYRFLKSERFTHMQGKFVFVRGSIVHGSTAKTVIG